MYPPHMIALAALYLVCVLNPHTRNSHLEWIDLQERAASTAAAQTGPSTRRSSRHSNPSSSTNTSSENASVHSATSATPSTANGQSQSRGANGANTVPPQDFLGFWANLNVSMPMVATIAQEMLSFYALCGRLKDEFGATPQSEGQAQGGRVRTGSRSAGKRAISKSESGSNSTPSDFAGLRESLSSKDGEGAESRVTSAFLVRLLLRMRAQHEADVAHPPTGRPVAVNKMLERAQAAG